MCRLYAVFPAVNEKAETLYVVLCLRVENGFTASEKIWCCIASALQPENLSER